MPGIGIREIVLNLFFLSDYISIFQKIEKVFW
jgi:hypothetical protein